MSWKRIHVAWWAVTLLPALVSSPSCAGMGNDGPTDVAASERSFVDIADRVGPAVVSIVASYTIVQRFSPWGDEFMDQFFHQFMEAPQQERRQQVQSAGSGVIVTADGTILTNAHVIANARNVTVYLSDKKEYKAKIVGRDEDTDLAVLKIVPVGHLVAAPLGDSDRIHVGQWAIAIGNPFALENTMTVGVISAKGRKLNDSEGGRTAHYTSFIQTDASINKGNSGGPLLNIRGEVIGINSMIFSPSGGSVGIGFAIPINLAKSVMEGLIKEGKIVRPQLGVAYQPLTPEVRKKMRIPEGVGMEVNKVFKGTAAEKAGLKAGDILLAVDRKPLRDADDLRTAVLQHRVGDALALEILRNGSRLTIQVLLREQAPVAAREAGVAPGGKEEGATATWLGLTVEEMTEDIARQLEARDDQGVVVTKVDQDSPAMNAGVQRGDVVREIENQPVTNLAAFTALRQKVGEKDGVLLLVERQGSTMYVVVSRAVKGGGE